MNTDTPSVTEVAQSLRDIADLIDSGDLGEFAPILAEHLAHSGLRAYSYRRDQFARAAADHGGYPSISDSTGTEYLAVTRTVGVLDLVLSGPAARVGERTVVGTETVERVEWTLPALTEEAS
jgi:hypothetical protein